MTDPTPQTTPTRDEAVPMTSTVEPDFVTTLTGAASMAESEARDETDEGKAWTLNFLAGKLRDAAFVITTQKARIDASAPAPASGGVDAVGRDRLVERALKRCLPLIDGISGSEDVSVPADDFAVILGLLKATLPNQASAVEAAYERAILDAERSFRRNRDRSWVLACLRERIAKELTSLSPAATPVSEAEPVAWRYRIFRETSKWTYEHRKAEIDCRRNSNYEIEALYTLAKPASSPAPVRPIGNQGISDYQREIARNMAEGFAAWNAARQEALPSDEPASSPAGGDVVPGLRAEIAHDGFSGDIIGRYVTREGKRGAVIQQDGTRVVHVYGEKWLPVETQIALSQSTSAGRVGE